MKYTRFASKQLWHFPMDGHAYNIFLEISIKVRCACTSKINQMKQYGVFILKSYFRVPQTHAFSIA